MSGLEVIEVVGTVAFFGFSLACAYLSVHVDRFSIYGREALLAAAALLFTGGLMRALVFCGVVEREDSIIVNSVAAISFLLIGLQLAALRTVQTRHVKRKEQT